MTDVIRRFIFVDQDAFSRANFPQRSLGNQPPDGPTVSCKYHLQNCGNRKELKIHWPPVRRIRTSASIALFCNYTLAMILGPVLTKRAASSVKHPHVSALAANICA